MKIKAILITILGLFIGSFSINSFYYIHLFPTFQFWARVIIGMVFGLAFYMIIFYTGQWIKIKRDVKK